jgi:hypothetical protein
MTTGMKMSLPVKDNSASNFVGILCMVSFSSFDRRNEIRGNEDFDLERLDTR